MDLTPKQQRFVEEYLVDLNAKQAAIRAGYSPRTAEFQASRLLRNANVQSAIAAGRKQQQKRTGITADRTLREIARLAFSDIGLILDFTQADPRLRPANEIPLQARRAISSVKVRRYWEGRGDDAREVEVMEFKLWDKLNALDKLCKHLGLLKEREPLEVLIAALPFELAQALRSELARILQPGGVPASGGAVPASADRPAPPEPLLADGADGDAAGPLAAGFDPFGGAGDHGPLHPPGWEEPSGGDAGIE